MNGTRACWLSVVMLVASLACSSPPKQGDNSTTEPTTVPVPTGEPAATACTTDTDCRIVADYCTGCDCRVLAKDEKDPTCSGSGVKCVADPCMGKTAVCEAGACTTRASAR